MHSAAILAAWIIAASTHVPDAAGHFASKPIAQEGAEAIADVCMKTRGAVPGSSVACAAVYLVMAFRESGYDLHAVGDGGRSHGPFQTRATPKTWAEAVAIYTPMLQRSASTCAEPLAMVASGSCTNKAGIAISRARMQAAKDLVLAVPFKAEGDT